MRSKVARNMLLYNHRRRYRTDPMLVVKATSSRQQMLNDEGDCYCEA
jgi:hypothetical protein